MKKQQPDTLLNFLEESGSEIHEEEYEREAMKEIEMDSDDDMLDISQKVKCMTVCKCQTMKRGEEFSSESYGLWRKDQKTRAARLEKELKRRWEFEELIEEQLNRYEAYYNRAMIPTKLTDVAQHLTPKWAPPQELASIGWLGDWRPSAMLDLLCGLVRSLSTSSSSSDQNRIEKLLSDIIHEIRIEEAIIDEQLAEIQATCILHLPFSPVNNYRKDTAALPSIKLEFQKIDTVIKKAQQLRFKALELVVKKVLNLTDTAEFLVAFGGIQDVIHTFAAKQKLAKRSVTIPVKGLMALEQKAKNLEKALGPKLSSLASRGNAR